MGKRFDKITCRVGREMDAKLEITDDNIHAIVQKEIGIVFAKVLECAGVYKRTPEGKAAFQRFLDSI